MSGNPDRIANDYAAAIDVCKHSADAAALYSDALATYGTDGVNWRTINGAVLRRWSERTLDAIKRKAWKTCQDSDARWKGAVKP